MQFRASSIISEIPGHLFFPLPYFSTSCFFRSELLTGPGKISAEQAKLHAETEYEKYRIIQDRLYESDFDRFLMLEQEVNRKDEV